MAGDKENTQTFSFETVAVLVAVLKAKGGNLGMKDYQQMAALDGTRTASGFDHLFRKVKARANEILEKNGEGTATTPTPKKNGTNKNTTPASKSAGKKRGKKDTAEDDDEESPSKKTKTEVKEEHEDGEDFA